MSLRSLLVNNGIGQQPPISDGCCRGDLNRSLDGAAVPSVSRVKGLAFPHFRCLERVGVRWSGSSLPARFAPGAMRGRGAGSRLLLFTLECALGIVAVILVAALAHWSGWLLPVAALLYLLIVVPIALLCGFWQAVIVSLSAVFLHSIFITRQAQANLATDPANSVALLAFVIVALVVSRLSSRLKDHAQEAESWGGRKSTRL